MKRIIIYCFGLFLLLLFSGCLTVEKKQYTVEFTGKNSGKLTIKYINIMSMPGYDEEEDYDASSTDFEDLVQSYIIGDRIETDYPLAKNITKRIFEENGQLCGEVTMEFDNIGEIRFYQHNKKSPIMFNISNAFDGELYDSSNGVLGNEDYMNVVFWNKSEKKLMLTTSITAPDEETVSLLDYYNSWKKE